MSQGMMQGQSKTCPNCGSLVPLNTKFCPNCGANQVQPQGSTSSGAKPKFCPECGSAVGADAKFCPNCGKQF